MQKKKPKHNKKKPTDKTDNSLKFTKPKKKLWLDHYAKNYNVSKACKHVGLKTRDTFYRHLKNDTEFAKQFQDVEDAIIDQCEETYVTVHAKNNPNACHTILKLRRGKKWNPEYKIKIDGELKGKLDGTHTIKLKEIGKNGTLKELGKALARTALSDSS